MRVWKLQEVKAKLTQLIENSKFEDQSMVSFLRKSPLNGIEMNFSRDLSFMREIDL